MADRIILHCDLNNFFASVSLLYNPTLKNMPVAVCGDKEIYIENHEGLLEYSDEIISVKMRDGIIRLCGHKLRIIALRSRDIVVNGEFERVEYEKIGRKIKKC